MMHVTHALMTHSHITHTVYAGNYDACNNIATAVWTQFSVCGTYCIQGNIACSLSHVSKMLIFYSVLLHLKAQSH